ncbi:glutathione binding-like protein [Pseudomonas sp. SJZ079]|uniref:glutathione binding-like protein n=1 Tax=Pseudomonas sp. SJZ079 TaxID=2572887 RepID=UPI00211391A9|nr:glutathione binding-like protein [Pseudomonas sp. SJZ079]
MADDLFPVLGNQPYLAGDKFSVADITAFAGLAFADLVKLAVPADLQQLRAWRQPVAARSSIAFA